jgi:hypothetical protein
MQAHFSPVTAGFSAITNASAANPPDWFDRAPRLRSDDPSVIRIVTTHKHATDTAPDMTTDFRACSLTNC